MLCMHNIILSLRFKYLYFNLTILYKMKILVCISSVPDTTSKISFTDNNTNFDKSGVTNIIGPYDDYALARAVELKEQTGGTLTVLNVGTVETEPQIRKALAIGADDAIRVDAEPTDSYFVAEQIAHVAKDAGYDLIMMGRETTDYNSGVVHGIVGELLGIPSLSPVMELSVEGNKAKVSREIEGGKEKIEATLPLVLGCQEPIAAWKIASMRGIMNARNKSLNVVPAVGESLTSVSSYSLPPAKGACKMIPAEEAGTLIELLRTEAKVI